MRIGSLVPRAERRHELAPGLPDLQPARPSWLVVDPLEAQILDRDGNSTPILVSNRAQHVYEPVKIGLSLKLTRNRDHFRAHRTVLNMSIGLRGFLIASAARRIATRSAAFWKATPVRESESPATTGRPSSLRSRTIDSIGIWPSSSTSPSSASRLPPPSPKIG